MNRGQQRSGSGISWGKIIAGAAVVAGVALFAPGVLDKIAEFIANLFSSTPEPMSEYTKEILKKVGGAALIGGGVSYFLSGKKENAPRDNGGFREQLEMDRMNNLMVMRAAYAGNPQAQAMMQRGR